jgi:hypothetical protein
MTDAPHPDPDVAAFQAEARRFGAGYAAFSMLFRGRAMTLLTRAVSWFILGMAALVVGAAVYARFLA